MHVLVLNCGSSSIKFALMNVAIEQTLVSGLAECLNTPEAILHISQVGQARYSEKLSMPDYPAALSAIFKCLHTRTAVKLDAIGHRVVHGGELFSAPALINDTVLTQIESCNALAPLHNPANLTGIMLAQKQFPQLPQIAVFDTAFHQTLPAYAYLYAIPYEYYKKHYVRRYGFHGTSHAYVAHAAAKLLDRDLNASCFISAHLGNGCSVAAIKHGKSIDTSMGMTPLEGLVMGTRSGDIDAGLVSYLANKLNTSINEVLNILNKESGLLGISELSADMRTLESEMKQGNQQAQLAIELFCYRLAKYIASYYVPLQRVDALIFTGGIGENSPYVRETVLNWLAGLHYQIDGKYNALHGQESNAIITQKNSPLAMVVNTNEELMIAKLTQTTIEVTND